MKRNLLSLVLVTSVFCVNAQDILTFNDRSTEEVKVLEVSTTEVKYKMFNYHDEPVFIQKSSNLFSINNQNGIVNQFESENKEKPRNFNPANSEKKVAYTKQIDLYIQNGWGIGFMFRKEINSYIGWNIAGFSYMSGWNNPKDGGIINLRLSGLRLYMPIYKSYRMYADLNMGYSFVYSDNSAYFNSAYYNNYYSYLNGYGYGSGYGYNYMENYYDGRDIEKFHCFGLDFSAGIQLHKNITIGYNLSFLKSKDGKATTHWGKISVLL